MNLMVLLVALLVSVELAMCSLQCATDAECGSDKCCFKYNTGVQYKRSFGEDASMCIRYTRENENCLYSVKVCGCTPGLTCMYKGNGDTAWLTSDQYNSNSKRSIMQNPNNVQALCKNPNNLS